MFSSPMLLLLTALAAVSLFIPVHANYTAVDVFQGATFFDTFDFFTESDPTHGFVDYVTFDAAAANQLVGLVNSTDDKSSVYLGADFQSKTSSGRQSVRVQSRQAWTHGLLIADIVSTPNGCGTWPALWMLSHSPTWPGDNGEIDILEGVNKQSANAMTLHTSAGCALTGSNDSFTGTMVTSNCDVNAPGQAANAGCSIVAPVNDTITMNNQSCSHATAGTDFNLQGGGVYAMLWTSSALTFWFYPRGYIPNDITAGHPDPSSWQKPIAHMTGCDFDSHLSNLSLVINLSFCGDWAGRVFATDGCATSTAATCDDYVGQNPDAFANSYWLINGITMYQNASDAGAHSKRDFDASERSPRIPTVDLSGRSLSSSSGSSQSSSEKARWRMPAVPMPVSRPGVDTTVRTSSATTLKAGIQHDGGFASSMLAIVGAVVSLSYAAWSS